MQGTAGHRCGSAEAAGPVCGTRSSRVHSGYARSVADFPAAGRYLRRSLPLLGLLAQIGLVLAGRAEGRLAGVWVRPVHRTTLLRLVAALAEPGIGAAPKVTGVDDFALRKGRVHGAVVVDVAAGKAVDLLPDRDRGHAVGTRPGWTCPIGLCQRHPRARFDVWHPAIGGRRSAANYA